MHPNSSHLHSNGFTLQHTHGQGRLRRHVVKVKQAQSQCILACLILHLIDFTCGMRGPVMQEPCGAGD